MKTSEWIKIICVAFLTALFFVVLNWLFVPQVGRYQKITVEKASDFYMDTANGKIYRINGKIFSEPK